MSPFESFLSGQFEDYIAYRQNLGYDTKSLLWVLRTLDRHLLEKKPALTDLTSAFFLSLKTSLHVQRKSINCLLSTTRMSTGMQKCTRNGNEKCTTLPGIPW